MIVSDLDGTLFNSYEEQYQISQKLIDEIHKFEKKGNIFTIATGRPKETSIDVIKKLGISSPYIVQNGAEIIDNRGKKIYSDSFQLKKWFSFLEDLQKIDVSVIFSYDGQVFCLNYTEGIREHEKKERINCNLASKDLLESDITVNKILIIGNVKTCKEHWNEIDDFLKSEFRYVISEENYFEILRKNVSKGNALKRLKQYLKMKDEEVVTIGNHMNDKELLEEAYVGVAVANATEELKNIANFVTLGEYEEGVIEVIKKFS